MRRLLLIFLSVTLALPITPTHANTRIASITDGDTVKLTDGRSVRLLQIDTPELNENECYAKEAQVALANLLNIRGALRLTTDPNLDKVDAYGRILRYIFKGKVNINLKMVKIGAATPYFYKRELGRYSTKLLKAAESARDKKLGLWSACPGTKLDPYRALTTSNKAPATPTWQCDPNYEGMAQPTDQSIASSTTPQSRCWLEQAPQSSTK